MKKKSKSQTKKGEMVVLLDLAAILNYVTKSVIKLYYNITLVFHAIVNTFLNTKCIILLYLWYTF